MANTSKKFINSTPDFLSSPTFEDCFKGSNFPVIFYYSMLALCFFLGTPAHLWCLRLYFCTEQKIKVTHVLLLNNIIMEIIYCIKGGIDVLNMYIFQNDIFLCVISFFFGLSWTGRPLLQTCICIEQYMAVIHPVTFLRYKSIKYRIAASLAAWLIAFVYGLYKVYTVSIPDFTYSIVFIIALIVISFCCVSVLCALKHPGPGDTHSTKQTSRHVGNQQKRNAFNTIFSALLLILFTYFPQGILIVFWGNEVCWTFFSCSITLFMTTLNNFGAIITPMLKIYKEGCFKMSKLLNGN